MTASFSLKEVAWKRILFVFGLIFVPNLLILQAEIAGPVNDVLGLGAAIDLVIILPLALFFFGFRKKVPMLVLFVFMFLGLLLANVIIPQEASGFLTYFNYSILAMEALIITIELFIFVTVLRKLPTFVTNFKKERDVHYHFLLSFTSAIQKSISFEKKRINKFQFLTRVLATDIAAIYYSLFSWRKRAPIVDEENSHTFTIHKDGAYFGVFFMLVHAMLIEMVAIHFLVYQFNHILAWIITAIDIYALLFIIADYQAIRLSPVIIDQKGLRFQKGIRQFGFISLEDIDRICENTKTVKEVEKDKKSISLALHGLEKEPIPYVINLNRPVEIYHYFGKKKRIKSIYFKMDDTKGFIAYIERRKQRLNDQ